MFLKIKFKILNNLKVIRTFNDKSLTTGRPSNLSVVQFYEGSQIKWTNAFSFI